MNPTGLKLRRDLLHERPGGQSTGQGSQRAPLVKARGRGDVMPLPAGISPEVGGRPGVPCVE
eukprot:3587279-Alexandrium_andersonii.AAC.1